MERKKTKRNEQQKRLTKLRLPPIELDHEDSTKVKTVLDIDPDYFSLVDGRPIRPSTSINAYKKNIRDVSLKRTVHGFLTDEILRIDKEIATENNIYEIASKQFEECKKSFDKFLAYDNDKTIYVMKESDTLNKELMIKTEEYKKINYEMASLKSKLQYIDETLLILLSFESFLHKVSPHLWQKSMNINLNVKHSEILPVHSDVFQKVDINLIKDRLSNLASPRLYFESPEQLLNIFYLLEKQNLNYLLITEEMNSIKNSFLNTRNKFMESLKHELHLIEEKIRGIENIIQWHQIKETNIKEVFYKILHDKIWNLITSECVLQIYTYVEYTYEQLIAPNETKQSALEMTLALESEYNNIMLELSAFDLNVVKQIEKEIFSDNTKKLKKAKEANKVLKNIDNISKRLKNAYEPNYKS